MSLIPDMLKTEVCSVALKAIKHDLIIHHLLVFFFHMERLCAPSRVSLCLCSVSCILCFLAGAFKVNQLPASPFEGARHHSGGGGGGATSTSNSSGATGKGPFGSRLMTMSHSMDTTNSNSGLQSANQGDPPGTFRGLASSASQKENGRSPKGRESPFETLRQQQQQQVSCLQPCHLCACCLATGH